MLYIITPCSRPQNLAKMQASIQFDKIEKWIVVHDSQRSTKSVLSHPQILELFHADPKSKVGNAQKNIALQHIPKVEGALLYVLDDDNEMHPEFWKHEFATDCVTTFDQLRNHRSGHVMKGPELKDGQIDTAMMVIPSLFARPWQLDLYASDGRLAEELRKEGVKHVYVNKVLCFRLLPETQHCQDQGAQLPPML